MPRDYGKIESGFWTNPMVRALSEDGQRLFLYLCTNKHCNGSAAYMVSMGYMTDDLGWTPERINKAFADLEVKPHVLRDDKANVVWIPGWWDHNKPENPQVAAFCTKNLLSLPDCGLKHKAIQGLVATGYRAEAVRKTLGDWRYDAKQDSLPFAPPAPPPKAEDSEDDGEATGVTKKGTRIDDAWAPTSEMRDYALKKGFTEAQIDAEIVKFVRYFTGPDAKTPAKKDWHRTWCNWMDKAFESLPKRPAANGSNGGGYTPEETPWRSRVDGFRTKKLWLANWGPEPGHPGCKVPPQYLTPE